MAVLALGPNLTAVDTSFFLGNIFICQQKGKSAAYEGDTDDEDGSSSAGVIYKIGINLLSM